MIDWDRVREEAIGILKDLVRIDTTNPPGNERAAVDYVAKVLGQEGIDFTTVEKEPGRTSLVARLRGSGRKGPLLLNAHLDVVPADPEHWTHDPFGAVEADGCIWGRGTLDMKNMAAMSLVTMLLLRREQVSLDRDVIFAAVADEEAGSNLGSIFLVEEHPELVRAEYVLNEVGAHTLHIGDSRLYPIQVAEKGICWFDLIARGEPGHGSMPHPANAVVRLAESVRTLGTTRLPHHSVPVVDRFVRALAKRAPFPGNWILPLLLQPAVSEPVLSLLERTSPEQALGLNAMLRNTVSPTMLEAGKKVNVIPSSARARLDGRVLPTETMESFLEEVRKVVGDEVDIEIVDRHEGSIFEEKTELFDHLRSTLEREDPEGTVVSYMIPGFTDSFAYGRLGATCYGFVPLRLPKGIQFTRLYHGHDERVPVDGFAWGVRALHDVVRDFCKIS